MFHPDKIVVNLQKMEFLCKREHGGNAGDKLKAFNQATGEFGLSRGGGVFFGKGRSKADSITGPLGTQIILFFGYVKQHAYKRTKAADPFQQVPTDSHIRGAIDGLKRMQIHSYANEAEKRNRLGEIIQEVEALFNFQLNNIDYQHWGKRALEITRNTRLFKSTNKIYEQDLASLANRTKNLPSPNIFKIAGKDYSGVERYDEANRILVPLRVAVKKGEISHKMQTDFAALTGVGNCGELSMIAYHFLDLHKIHPIARFCLDGTGDHVFLALGADMNDVCDPASQVQNLPFLKSTIKRDFNDWPAGIYICDPWANIFCKASNYPLEFQHKMSSWSVKGKLVSYRGQWIKPTDQNYHLSVATYDKVCTNAVL